METQQLHEAYTEIMGAVPVAFLDKRVSAPKPISDLSGAFLPTVAPSYFDAPHRIMIVGRETRGWKIPQPDDAPFDLNTYVQAAMDKHLKFFDSQINGKDSKGRAFHNFTRRIARRCGQQGLLYSNLFCFAWNGKNPQKHPDFQLIARTSKCLLDAQIEILKPDVIVFCNGVSSAGARREFFPIKGEQSVCTDFRYYPEHKGAHLWEFTLHNRIRCLRVPHPSAYSRNAALAHDFLIENLLPERLEQALQA